MITKMTLKTESKKTIGFDDVMDDVYELVSKLEKKFGKENHTQILKTISEVALSIIEDDEAVENDK